MFKSPGHGIFSANRRNPQLILCTECTKKGSKGTTPLLWIRTETLEIFLQCQSNRICASTRRCNLRHSFNNRKNCTMKRTPCRKIRVKTKRHHRSRICLPKAHRNLCNHCFCGGQLIFPAKRHENGGCANSGVKALAEPLLTAYVQVAQITEPRLLKITSGASDDAGNLLQIRILLIRCLDKRAYALTHAVRREEAAREPHDLLAAPLHNETRLRRHDRDAGCFEIFGVCVMQKRLNIPGRKHNRHTLL